MSWRTKWRRAGDRLARLAAAAFTWARFIRLLGVGIVMHELIVWDGPERFSAWTFAGACIFGPTIWRAERSTTSETSPAATPGPPRSSPDAG